MSTWEVCCPPMVTAGQISNDASAWPHQLRLLYTTFGRTNMSISTKICIYQALVQSVLLYAAETWTSCAIDIKALEAFHMKYQRQLLQISWQQFIRNDEVAVTTGLPAISEVISNRRNALFGHVARLQQDVPADKALHCHVDLSLGRPPNDQWKRRPGRPRETDRPGSEGQWNPPSGSVKACDESWSPRSNATALAGFVITTTTTA